MTDIGLFGARISISTICLNTDAARKNRLSGIWHGVFISALALVAAFALEGCASHVYAGISLAPGAAPTDLQALAERAQAGDKHAQYELGMRFQEGRGVSADLVRARQLYRSAAADTGGTVFVYQSPTRKGDSGHVIPVDTGPENEGLLEARLRLAATTVRAKRQLPSNRRVVPPPPGAVVEAAYVRWANWTCEQMIDVCPDDALVLPASVHAEKIECDVKSDRATCTFDIVRFRNAARCRGTFKLERNLVERFWVAEVERNRPTKFKPLLKCSSS